MILMRLSKAQNWTDDLPKLFPSWHAIVDQHYLQRKDNKRFIKDRLPDFGGAGIDLSTDANDTRYDLSKHEIDQVRFGAEVCALPFFPFKKAQLIEDPCLSLLDKQKKEFHEFCVRLNRSRVAINNVKYVKHRKTILNAHKVVKNMCLSGKFDKVVLPENIVRMATILPKNFQLPSVNFAYSGGCLTTLKTDEASHTLLYPCGKKLNRLAVTPIEETPEENRAFKPTSERSTVKLKGGRILQIKSAYNGYCYVKQENRCHFVNLTNPSEADVTELRKPKSIRNIAPSPFIPVEFISLHEDGRIILNDVNESNSIWKTDHYWFSEKYLCDTPIDCGFGSHPRSILYLDDKKMHAFDARLKQRSRCSIFSCKHISCYTHESFLAMKRLSVNPFQHLILSNYHLFVCDERYPEKPVMLWNHSLKGSPLYCDITNPDSSGAAILLGTQDTQEMALFTIRTRQSTVQTISLSPPLFLSSPSDWTNTLRCHGQHIEDNILKRTSYPLIGVCAVPHGNTPSLTAFQMTSLGDVFYQDFRKVPESTIERTYRVDMGCVLAPPQRILPHVPGWIRIPDTSEKVEKEDDTWDLVRKNVDLTNILKSAKEISDWCEMCQSITANCEDKLVPNEICPSCGLHKLESDQLHKVYYGVSSFIGPVLENPEIRNFDNIEEELSQFADYYSRNILNVWTSVEDNQSEAPLWDSYSDYNLDSMHSASNASYSDLATSSANVDAPSQLDDTQLSQLHSQSIFEGDTIPDFSMYSQESLEFVPPSQDSPLRIGRTITPRKKSKIMSQIYTSMAGF